MHTGRVTTSGGIPAGGAGTSGWRHFSHDADMGVCAEGATPEQVFEQMALGMAALITNPGGVAAAEDVEIADASGLARVVARREPVICIKG